MAVGVLDVLLRQRALWHADKGRLAARVLAPERGASAACAAALVATLSDAYECAAAGAAAVLAAMHA